MLGGWGSGGLGGRRCSLFLRRNHFERASGDVVVAPFDNDGVAALVFDGVGDVVELLAHVLDIHLLAGSMGSVHAHHQHVGTWTEQEEMINDRGQSFVHVAGLHSQASTDSNTINKKKVINTCKLLQTVAWRPSKAAAYTTGFFNLAHLNTF